ncbi:acyltransferase family protein, partial [Legionella micdadei]
VFICLLVVVTLLALLFYLPDDLVQYAKSARKTSIFTSNSYFSRVTTGYFAADSNQLPLLHTWSLSIEWQCYFILPVVIYLLNKGVAKRHLSKIIFGLTLLFLALALYFSTHNAAKTYYQFSSRIFEFLIGSCVALIPRQIPLNKIVLNLINLLALLALFYVATRTHISFGFPNGYALLLCVAAGTLIATGNHPQSLVTKCLATKPLVFIGLISYSLYIWHWPVFAFIHYLVIGNTNLIIFSAFCISFILAYLSWRFIEKPARKFKHLKFRYSLIYLLLLPIVLIHGAAHLIKKNAGLPERFNEEVVRIYEQLNQSNSVQRPLCIGKHNIDINSQCILGAKNIDSKKGFMIGDSYSNHYWGFMDTLAKDANLSILAQATSSCLTLPGIFLYDWWSFKNDVYQECYEQTTRYYDMIKANHYDFVIIGQTWKNYLGHNIINQLRDNSSPELTKKRITAALDNALQIITNSGAKPVLIKATASTTENLRDCFFQHVKQRKAYDPNQCDFNLQINAELWLNDLFEEMQKKYPQLIVIDPKIIQCAQGRCKADINGVPVFRDIGHITDYASYQLGKLYLQRYENPLTNKG